MKRLLLLSFALLTLSGIAQAQYDSNQVRKVNSLPATCTLGTTNAVVYQGVIYHCTATNTWTKSSPGSLPTSTYSGLPTCSSSNNGQQYKVTDVNRDVYICNGSSTKWISRNGGVYNVQDFGAKDDGVVGNASHTDNTAAIQAAINALLTAEGGVKGKVYFPRQDTGVYQINSPLTFPNNVISAELEGQDFYTYLYFPSLTNGQTGIDFSSTQKGSKMKNLRLYGPGGGATGRIGVSPGPGMTFDRVYFGAFATAIKTSGTINGLNIQDDCEFQGNGIAVWINGSGSNANNISGRYFANTNAIKLTSVENINIIGAWFELNNGTEFTIQDSGLVNIVDCWVESSHAYSPIQVSSISSYLTNGPINIEGNKLAIYSGPYLMEIDTAYKVTFRRNSIVTIAPKSILVNTQITDIHIEDNRVNATSSVSDRDAIATISVVGPGTVVTNHSPNDLQSPDGYTEFLGGFSSTAATNLISDPSFESSLGATAGGSSAPTVSYESSTVYYGNKSMKVDWNSGSASTSSQRVRIDGRKFSATSGNYYTISFSIKSSVPTRAVSLQNYSDTFGNSTNTAFFVDATTSWTRKTIIWKCDSTQSDWQLQFTLGSSTSSGFTTYIDDIQVVAGTVATPYVPSLSSIPAFSMVAQNATIAGTVTTNNLSLATSSASVSGSVSLDLSSGSIRVLTLTGTVSSLTATNIPTGPVWIALVQDATGGRTITTWNSLFLFAGGSRPTLTATANARDQFQFLCDGTNCVLQSAIYDVK